MSQNAEQRETGDIARSFFLQAAALFAAMLLPYTVLDGAEAPFAVVAILFAYVLLASFLKGRRKPGKQSRKIGYRTGFAITLYAVSGFMAASGIWALIVIIWFSLAYKPVEAVELPITITSDGLFAALRHALTMLAGGVVLLALSILLLHWGRGGLGVLAARLRRHGPGLFLSPWVSETAIVMLLFGESLILGMGISLDMLIEAMSPGRTATFLDMADMFPFLPLCMFLTAVTAVALVGLMGYGTFEAIIRALRDDGARPAPRDSWWPVLTTITLTTSAGTIAAALWALHVAIVAATASVSGLQAGTKVGHAVEYWAIVEHAAGRPKDELAALVNAKGYWTKAEPDGGLPEFLPGLDEVIAGFDLERECRIRVAAAPADPEDETIAEPGSPHTELPAVMDGEIPEGPGPADGAEAAGYGKPPPLRFCVKVICPAPVKWDPPLAVSLYSSHATGSRDWLYGAYFDFYAEGVASEQAVTAPQRATWPRPIRASARQPVSC